MAIFKGTKNEDGTYSMFHFIKRAFYLVSPRLFKEYLNRYYPGISVLNSVILLVDFYTCVVVHGAIVTDYFEYAFRDKSFRARRTFITMRDSRRIQKKYNRESAEVFINKEKFNTVFQDYRTIKNYYFNESSKLDDFVSYVISCNGKVLAKPLTGHSGFGIHKIDLSSQENIEKAFKTYSESREYFCEELFIQTGILGLVNPNSVNTVRIYTLYDGEQVNIMHALVRFGGGASCVDNIHGGGMICEVDALNGTVVGPGYDLMNNRTVYHKMSGKLLLGIQIPQWDRVVTMVKNAALLTPGIGHVAWDIAVSETEVCFIEANEQGNFDAPQCACQKGSKIIYANYL